MRKWWDDFAGHHQLYEPEELYAVPNGGNRDRVTGARLKREGVRAGQPDLNLDIPSAGYHGLRIEMKAGRGRVTAPQQIAIDRLNGRGYLALVCRSAAEAIEAIEDYLGIGGDDD